jgi:hypothetical protein
MTSLPSDLKKFFAWAVFLLLFSVGIAQYVNGDASRRWQQESEYNEALLQRQKGQ